MAEPIMPKREGDVTYYNPVQFRELVGTAFLGILGILLLVALLRSQARVRRLLREKENKT